MFHPIGFPVTNKSFLGINQPGLVVESAWRVAGKWDTMKEALQQVELASPREMAWRVNLYRGYLAICSPDDPTSPWWTATWSTLAP
jgi:hypothetical protein